MTTRQARAASTLIALALATGCAGQDAPSNQTGSAGAGSGAGGASGGAGVGAAAGNSGATATAGASGVAGGGAAGVAGAVGSAGTGGGGAAGTGAAGVTGAAGAAGGPGRGGAGGGAGVAGASGRGGAAAGATGAGGAPAPAGDACKAVRVGAGDMHSCALSGDGAVRCWGSNAQAQVGNGAASRQLTPLLVTAAGKDNVDLMVGHHVSCVTKTSGAVMCWGTFDDGAGWTNVRDPRAFDVFGSDWSQMIVDTSACVVRKSDRSVSCWGYANTQPTTITAFGTDVVHMDLEFRTVCVVKSGGGVMCKTDDAAPRAMTGVTDALKVGLRRDHNVLGDPEDVMVAGADGRGWYVHNGSAFRAMNLGGQQVAMFNAQHHLIGAVSRTGRVMMWHSAICGGFGDNNPPDDNGSTAGDRRNYTSDAPAVPTGFDMGATTDIALGHEHACVIRAADASVHCWGRNVEGQIGNGSRATECEVGAGSHNPGPDGNQMTPYRVNLCP